MLSLFFLLSFQFDLLNLLDFLQGSSPSNRSCTNICGGFFAVWDQLLGVFGLILVDGYNLILRVLASKSSVRAPLRGIPRRGPIVASRKNALNLAAWVLVVGAGSYRSFPALGLTVTILVCSGMFELLLLIELRVKMTLSYESFRVTVRF